MDNSDSIHETTVITTVLRKNCLNRCDLFETTFYKEYWHIIQDCREELFDTTIEELVQSLQP